MKKIMLCGLAAIIFVISCKKDSLSPGSSFWGCHASTYYFTYPSGHTDTTIVTYISDDSLSYTLHATGGIYIYCFKIKGDSVILRTYENNLSTLFYYGSSLLNSQKFAVTDDYFHGNGTPNNSGNSTYNSEGRAVHTYSDYGTYQSDYINYFDGNGNKTYTIANYTGLSPHRDSFAYDYNLTRTNKAYYGYPYSRLYGIPDKNLVLQIRRYDTNTDTLNSYSNYTYILDPDGYISQKTTVTSNSGSGGAYTYIEKFIISCSN